MDRMRESLFAVLGNLHGASFLDLFSGSGIIALEAASRGAVHIEAVEADRQKLASLIKNCSISPVRINCHCLPAELFIQRAAHAYDFIFCDPPFPYQHKHDLVTRILNSRLMGSNSMLLIHYQKKEKINLQENELFLVQQDSRQYGNSVVDFFIKT
jgi:16S rRNA (guanine(966)-N(2))-methyltransferase RsmD